MIEGKILQEMKKIKTEIKLRLKLNTKLSYTTTRWIYKMYNKVCFDKCPNYSYWGPRE